MSVVEQVKIVTKEQLKNDIFKLAIESEKMASIALPGQFLEIRVNDDIEPFLRRPISIYKIDKEKNELEFIFQVKGKGTEILVIELALWVPWEKVLLHLKSIRRLVLLVVELVSFRYMNWQDKLLKMQK